MSPPVVTNAGPLMVLAKLNTLHLLKRLYGQVAIPQAVYAETVSIGRERGFLDAATLHLFLTQQQWQPLEVRFMPADLLTAPLDQGEKEAIALAMLQQALLLMDEERGREIARQKGVVVRGSLGVLIEAYRNALITAEQLRFYFNQIAERPDIWISPKLCLQLLKHIFPA